MAQTPSKTTSPSSAREAAEAAKHKASEVAGQAKDEAKDQLAQKKQQATGSLDDVADAMHAAGDRLEQDDRDAFASYAHNAANQVEHLVQSVRNRSVGEILDEAERFARREPGLFIGGAFLLGIVGARFLKASEPGTGRGWDGSTPGMPGSYGGRSSGDLPDYSNETKHGRPLVTETPGGRMPETSRPTL